MSISIVLMSSMLDAGAKGRPPIGSSGAGRPARLRTLAAGVRPWRRAIGGRRAVIQASRRRHLLLSHPGAAPSSAREDLEPLRRSRDLRLVITL